MLRGWERNMKKITILSLIALANLAGAQSFRTYWAFGDPVTAAQNGATVGSEVSKWGLLAWAKDTMTLQLRVEGLVDSKFSTGSLFIGYDRTVNKKNYVNQAALDADVMQKVLSPGQNLLTLPLGTGIPVIDHAGNELTGNVESLGASKLMSRDVPGKNVYIGGVSVPTFGFGTGQQLNLKKGASVKLIEVKLQINYNFALYGFRPDQAGFVGLVSMGGETSSHNGWLSIPEPASMLALSAGLVGLARRRRS